ncbi:MAG: carboxylating nicotinate-nucleotide diphosphorylase [Myxococcales bacterium]|nr:carboxylating nicotinate-nucleotide diphosphorylase [Myxococcales bacterium]MCB9645631.1 carboxylating nicotinate-nucleotide diphosphorylase [Deltaproteobacteria bacterium]
MALDHTSRQLIALALAEDIGPQDLTSALLPEDLVGEATVRAKDTLVLSGFEAVEAVFAAVDPRVEVRWANKEGDLVEPGAAVGSLRGPARSLLTGERLALNLLQRLCGVATMAHKAAQAVAGTKCKVVDTRKTTPAMRALQKAAVRHGGAYNHRFGLFDGVLIKDNHIAALGSITKAVERAREVAHHLVRVEVEVESLAQLDEALAAGADVVLLDNMDTATMRTAVQRTAGRALLEASGNVTLARLPEIAATGVDYVSMGALTHSAPSADIALDWGA